MLQKKSHGASTVSTNAVFLIKLRIHQISCFGWSCFDPDVAAVRVLSVGCVELSPHRIKPKDEFVSCSCSSLIWAHGKTHERPVSFRGRRGQLVRETGAEQWGVYFIFKMFFLLVSSFVLIPFFREGGSVLSDFVEFNHGKIPSGVARDN